MGRWYKQYQQGDYQRVYDELLRMENPMDTEEVYRDAQLIGRVMMRKVRSNIELLIARLRTLQYRFGEGFVEDASPEEQSQIAQDVPPLKTVSAQEVRYVQQLEEKMGPLPLLVKYFYEEVGGINLIGTFPLSAKKEERIDYGLLLDPLFVYSSEMVVKMELIPTKQIYTSIPIAPDDTFKYGYSGSGSYSILLANLLHAQEMSSISSAKQAEMYSSPAVSYSLQKPFHFFDAPLLLEKHQTTFANYLRLCIRWGGFPGLEQENRLSPEQFVYLTEGLLPF